MYARKSLAVSLIISLAIIVLGGRHAPSKPEIEWSNQWGNSSGNILEDGYVAANGNTVCYASLNEAADALYSLSETGEITLISRKAAYDLNIVGNQVYFTNGLPGSICRIDIDGTNFKTLVWGEYRNLFVSQSHMAYLQGSSLVVSDLAGEHTTAIASDVRRFLPFDDTFLFITGNMEAGGLYQINPDGTEQECLFDRPIICLCSNSEAIYFSVSKVTCPAMRLTRSAITMVCVPSGEGKLWYSSPLFRSLQKKFPHTSSSAILVTSTENMIFSVLFRFLDSAGTQELSAIHSNAVQYTLYQKYRSCSSNQQIIVRHPNSDCYTREAKPYSQKYV